MNRLAWYCRDGHLDILPLVSAKLEADGVPIRSHYVCHHALDERRLKDFHHLEEVTVLGDWLRLRGDISPGRIGEIEARYGAMPIIRCSWGDRYIKCLSQAQIEKNLIGHFDFWESFLTEKGIDTLVIEVPSILSTCVAWVVCKTLGVRFLSPIDIAPLGDRMVMTSSWMGHYDGYLENLREPMDEGSEEYSLSTEFIERFQGRPTKTAESQRWILNDSSEYGRLPLRYLQRFREMVRRERMVGGYYVNSSGVEWLKNWLKVYLRRRVHSFRNVFERARSEEERFFLFPLHQLGEWSNFTWMGLEYADLVRLLERISACLPLGRKLYVKEHTSGFGEKSFAFYRAVKRIPSIRLIAPFEDTFGLLRRSECLITLGSSMGFEAMLLGKPVILLGAPWYVESPGTYRAETVERLAELLQAGSELKPTNAEERIRVLHSLYKISFQGWKFPHENAYSPENVARWANAIRERLPLPSAELVGERA